MLDNLILFGSLIAMVFNMPSRIDGDELFCFHSFLFLAALSWFVKPKREILNGYFGAMLLLALITTLFNFTFPVRANLINLFVGIMAIRFISERSTITVSKLAKCGVIFYAISLVFVILQKLKMEFIYQPQFDEIAGASTIPWMLGSSVCLFLPFVFKEYKLKAILLSAPLLWVSESFSCMVVAAFTVFCLVSRKKKLYAAVIALIALAFYFFLNEASISHIDIQSKIHRYFVWIKSAKYINNHFIGNGIGSWAHEGFIRLNGADQYHWRWAHNEVYQFFFEQGAIGLSILVAYFSRTLISVWSNVTLRTSLIGITLLSMMHPIFHFGRFLMILAVIISMCEIYRQTNKEIQK